MPTASSNPSVMNRLVDCSVWAVQCGVVVFSSLGAGRFKEGESMGTPTRRAVLKGTAALAGLAAVQASGLAPAAAAAPADASGGHPQGQRAPGARGVG